MQSRRYFLSLLASSAAASGALSALAQPGAATAPEFTGLSGWLNTAAPFSLAGLRGKVVLVNFWTYSCINCRRTVGYLNRWQAQYETQGLQVIGIHTPEFGFEHQMRNVADGVRELGIRYPVGIDNAYATWRAWGNEAWPAFYLFDRNGRIVLLRLGEDHARELEGAIRALLGLDPSLFAPMSGDDPDLSRIGTPEMYFGALHPTPQDRAQSPREGVARYAFTPEGPPSNGYQLDGTWQREEEALVLRSDRGGVRIRFKAAKLHVVASSPRAATVRVSVPGNPDGSIEISEPTLHTLFDTEGYVEHLVTIETITPGLTLYSTTFG